MPAAAVGMGCSFCDRSLRVDVSNVPWTNHDALCDTALRENGWIIWRVTDGAGHYACPDHANKARAEGLMATTHASPEEAALHALLEGGDRPIQSRGRLARDRGFTRVPPLYRGGRLSVA